MRVQGGCRIFAAARGARIHDRHRPSYWPASGMSGGNETPNQGVPRLGRLDSFTHYMFPRWAMTIAWVTSGALAHNVYIQATQAFCEPKPLSRCPTRPPITPQVLSVSTQMVVGSGMAKLIWRGTVPSLPICWPSSTLRIRYRTSWKHTVCTLRRTIAVRSGFAHNQISQVCDRNAALGLEIRSCSESSRTSC
jgi:hypothetical protein